MVRFPAAGWLFLPLAAAAVVFPLAAAAALCFSPLLLCFSSLAGWLGRAPREPKLAPGAHFGPRLVILAL